MTDCDEILDEICKLAWHNPRKGAADRGVYMLQMSTLLLRGPYLLSVRKLGFRVQITLNRRENLSIWMENMQIFG